MASDTSETRSCGASASPSGSSAWDWPSGRGSTSVVQRARQQQVTRGCGHQPETPCPPGRRSPVAVDALDEAASDQDRRQIAEVLAELAVLPGLRVAVATRP